MKPKDVDHWAVEFRDSKSSGVGPEASEYLAGRDATLAIPSGGPERAAAWRHFWVTMLQLLEELYSLYSEW